METPDLRWRNRSLSISNLDRARLSAFTAFSDLIRQKRSRKVWVASHTTALSLAKIELPILYPQPKRFGHDCLHVCVQKPDTRLSHQGVQFHLWTHEFEPVIMGEGMLCVPPVTAWAQMSQYLALSELIVLGDSMMRSDPRLKRADLADFHRYVENTRQYPGRSKCVKALTFVAANTDSSQETRTRLLLASHGLQMPAVNISVWDEHNKQNYRIDMGYPKLLIAIEYDGEQHFSDARQRENDDIKRRNLKAAGWVVHVVHKEDLRKPDRRLWLVNQIASDIMKRTSELER